MAQTKIRFGTSGWRAVLADEFTFGNARRAVSGIASYLESKNLHGLLLVGHDTRFLADRFAREAANLLRQRGFAAEVSNRAVPTPVLAFETIRRKAVGALNFTASHNPPVYEGLKFSTGNGAPALPEVTARIEAEIAKVGDVDPAPDAQIQSFDPAPAYLENLGSRAGSSGLSGFPVALDFRFGTSAGYLDAFFEREGSSVEKIHAHPDPLFGGQSPQCSGRELAELSGVVRQKKSRLGLATDGDADRFGVLDEKGTYLEPNAVLALVAWDLFRRSGSKKGIGRSVATTHALDAIARKFGVPLIETPVGFKYLGELILEGKILIGAEESAGLSIEGHVPDKDGILADALVARMVAEGRRPIGELQAELEKEIGPFVSDRLDLPVTEKERKRIAEWRSNPPDRIGPHRVAKTDMCDGVKFIFDGGSWMLFRESGTEPVARFYAEALSRSDVDALMKLGRGLLEA
ncbi:MAG: phosphoglucomutase/phosphomannomutase family protein [Thermoanaerobaculia bacterium]